MNKVSVFSALLGLSSLVWGAGPGNSLPTYEVKHLSGKIEVDGKAHEEDWKNANVLKLNNIVDGKAPQYGNTEVRLLWDSKGLYVSFKADDKDIWTTMDRHDSHVFKNDALEFFLDPEGDGLNYFEFEWNAHNVVFDLIIESLSPWQDYVGYNLKNAKWKSHLSGTLNSPADKMDEDKRLCMEIFIPWEEIQLKNILKDKASADGGQVPPKNGTQMRANFYRAEYPNRLNEKNGELETEWTSWSATGAVAAHKPEKFGILKFVK